MTDNRTTELLPCPFREHKRKKLVIHHRKCRWYEDGLYAVKCEICGIRGPYALSEEKAVEKWNARHVETCEPPYDELLRCLENDWHISASWDGLRKFWCIELTDEGARMRDAKVVD